MLYDTRRIYRRVFQLHLAFIDGNTPCNIEQAWATPGKGKADFREAYAFSLDGISGSLAAVSALAINRCKGRELAISLGASDASVLLLAMDFNHPLQESP